MTPTSSSMGADPAVAKWAGDPTPDPKTTTTNSSTTDKVTQIRKQLLFILHARQCPHTDVNSQCRDGPICAVVKGVMTHMKTCTDGKSCQVLHCVSSRQIIAHWMVCVRTDTACAVCSPIKDSIRLARMSRLLQQNPLVATQRTCAHSAKERYLGLTSQSRARSVEMLVCIAIRNPQLNTTQVHQMEQLLAFGGREEAVMFEMAGSQEEYFQLMPKLMSKMMEEWLQIRLRSSGRLGSEPNQSVPNNAMNEEIDGFDCSVLGSSEELIQGFGGLVLD